MAVTAPGRRTARPSHRPRQAAPPRPQAPRGHPASGDRAIPAAFIDGQQIVKGLPGTLTLLNDCGFGDSEALTWLFTADETLPGTPIDALYAHRGTEVNRRAQALAF